MIARRKTFVRNKLLSSIRHGGGYLYLKLIDNPLTISSLTLLVDSVDFEAEVDGTTEDLIDEDLAVALDCFVEGFVGFFCGRLCNDLAMNFINELMKLIPE